MRNIWQNPTYRFLILFLGSFTFLYYLNLAFIGISAPGGYYVAILDQHFNYIRALTNFLLQSTVYVLNLLGYKTFTSNNWLHVSGKGGFILAYECLGYGIMSFFTAFVLAYPKPTKSKYLFLPAGLILIQMLNITRFVLLSLYWRGSIFKGIIDHHDLFNLILYACLLLVIYLWINFGEQKKIDNERNTT
ncbi:MAG: hypothetical protein H7Y07_16690 [Pyrinomonadaceae bacterium]|nr:hypothetical protein [Sphingobacteriaceae bacterium]